MSQFSTVWSPTVAYSFPLRNGTLTGTTITLTYKDHFLATGDVVDITAAAGYEEYAVSGPVTVINRNTFSYTVPIAPSLPFPNPTPGSGVKLTLTCMKYSELMEFKFPGVVRVNLLDVVTNVDVQTLDETGWTSQQTMTSADGIIDLDFLQYFKFARLVLTSGTYVPLCRAVLTTVPALPPANTIYPIPPLPTVGSGEIPDIGIPGTYDVITTNAKGQVIAGTPLPGNTNKYVSYMNGMGVTISRGRPVRLMSGNSVEYAQGNSTKKTVIGLAANDILSGEFGDIIVDGVLLATTAEWQLVTGQPGGLVVDDTSYFLDFGSSGVLQRVPDIDAAPPGSYLVPVGYAVTGTEFKLEIEPPIKL